MRSLSVSRCPGIKTLPTGWPWHPSKGSCLSGTFGAYNNALHSKHHYSGAKIEALAPVTLCQGDTRESPHWLDWSSWNIWQSCSSPAVILLGTSCFNIQIVICHPTSCWHGLFLLSQHTWHQTTIPHVYSYNHVAPYHILAAPFIHDPNLSSHLKS